MNFQIYNMTFALGAGVIPFIIIAGCVVLFGRWGIMRFFGPFKKKQTRVIDVGLLAGYLFVVAMTTLNTASTYSPKFTLNPAPQGFADEQRPLPPARNLAPKRTTDKEREREMRQLTEESPIK